jgi:hypothetical protein
MQTSISVETGSIFSYWCKYAKKRITETFLQVSGENVMMQSLASYSIEELSTMRVERGGYTVAQVREAKPRHTYEPADVMASGFDLPYKQFTAH